MPNNVSVPIASAFVNGKAFKVLLRIPPHSVTVQLNFRVQCFFAVIAVALGFYLKISTNEWLWISLNITLVLFAELINTALETLVDLVSPGYNEKAGRVKDIAQVQ